MIERYVWDIYTDGSCNSKSRLGGCGVYMVNKTTGEEIFFREGYCNTTTPRMEMRAIVNALELLPKGNPIKARIVCDSEFVVKFMNHDVLMMERILQRITAIPICGMKSCCSYETIRLQK